MSNKQTIAEILNYQNKNVVKKYAQEQAITLEVAQEHFEECKKFLYVASIAQEQVSPSKILDEMWHTFILFTRDYQNFCYKYFGKFIHHQPGVGSSKTKKHYFDAFVYSRTLALSVFCEISESVWMKKKPKKQIAGHCDTGQCACGDDCGDS